MASKGPGGERQFVNNTCRECGAETKAVVPGHRIGKRAMWLCTVNDSHLFATRNYTVSTKK